MKVLMSNIYSNIEYPLLVTFVNQIRGEVNLLRKVL